MKNIRNLVGMNDKITWRQIQKILNKWNYKYLTILEMIRAVKMFIIPKMLYLFQVLLEWLSKKQLATWDLEIKTWVFGKRLE